MKQVSNKRTNIVQFLLYDVLRVIKFILTETRMLVSGAGGVENGKLVFNRFRVSRIYVCLIFWFLPSFPMGNRVTYTWDSPGTPVQVPDFFILFQNFH